MGPFRITPSAPASMFQTYSIRQPEETHTRAATCDEVGCTAYALGWITRVPAGSALEAAVRSSGRRWSGAVVADGAEVAFTFPPGTACFRASTHRASLDRPATFVVRGGDWRGNPTGMRRVHQRPEDWVEDFAEHSARVEQDRS